MNASSASESAPSDFMKRLPGLLRILGAGALIVAMYGFLVRGWHSGNDVSRYLMLLGHTGLLAAIGLASGHWLKEGKGARLLLTLALVSVPANFAILGAFIMSQTNGVGLGQYPHYVSWAVDSLATALMTTAGAMLVLVPVTLLGFTVLARGMSRALAVLFIMSNLALLLPLRDPQWIALLVAMLAVGVVGFMRKAAHDQSAAKTGEGLTALGLQLLPLAVLLGRSLWLYNYDLFLATVTVAGLFFTLRQVSLHLQPGSALHRLLDGASVIPALWLLPLFSRAMYETGLFPNALAVTFGTMVAAALVYDISRRNERQALAYQRLAILVLWIGMLGNLLVFSGTLAALACVGVGAAVMGYGYRVREIGLLSGGAVLVIAGVFHQLIELVHHFDFGSWVSLAVLGVVSIVIGSVLESQSAVLRLRFVAWREQVQAWGK